MGYVHGKHKNGLQKRDNGWKTFGHENHWNETANVTVLVASPLYTVLIPMAKNTMANVMAMKEIILTN
jgi:hypothetical protein